MAPQNKKSKMIARDEKTDSSTIVDFPNELVEKIISHFPIKIATSAALVSKRFINSWKLCRNLCFDVNKQSLPEGEFASIVDHVMNQHCGSKIERLVVIIDPTHQENRINEWIQKAVSKGVEELDLNFFGGNDQAHPIISDLIDVKSIRVLKLRYCEPQFAMQLNGLRFLKRLLFEKVSLTLDLMHTIFGNCLVLEYLELINCNCDRGMQIFAGHLKHFKSLKVAQFEDIESLYINAPTLETFYYNGKICSFFFTCCLPTLNVATFNFGQSKKFQPFPKVEDLMMSLIYCENLTICSTILEGLSPKFRDFKYTEIPFKFLRMKEFRLFLGGSGKVRGSTFVNPCDIVYFLKKCPLINKIDIDLGDYPFEEGLYWNLVAKERFKKCCPSFQFLKNLRMKGFKYHDLEFKLLKVIVENAPSLQNVILITAVTSKQIREEKRFLDWMETQDCNIEVYKYNQNKRSGFNSNSLPGITN